MEASSSTAQQISPQGNNTNDQVSDDALPSSKEMGNSQNSGQGNINDQVSVDVNALTSSLEGEITQLHPISRDRCIYRVPKRLRVINENAYTPRCVSIGPYHHGKDELKAMEEHKIMYLQHFLKLSEVSLHEFVSCVMNNETSLRNYYQERIDLSSERFLRLMLVDAAFVIMVMLRSVLQFCNEDKLSGLVLQLRNEDELLFNKPRMIWDIRNDMILLENQLPFFILERIFDLSKVVKLESFSMVKLSSDFLDYEFTSWVVKPSGKLNFSESKHLVDFLRIRQQPLEQNKHKAVNGVNLPSAVELALNVVNLPSAVELNRAGVKLQRAGVKFQCDSSLRFVDIKFHHGTLEIPLLTIEDPTEILFRNVQAFEQSHLYNDENRYFNDYITMISLLVTNGKDVEILTKEGIIENLLHGNEQVVHLLHNLAKENDVNTKKFYFADVVNDLNQYCRKRRNRWWASLLQNYLHNPWVVISVIAATFVILLAIVQTICSILQVKQHK